MTTDDRSDGHAELGPSPGSDQTLLDAIVGMSSDLDLGQVLRRIVEGATALAGAQYGALGVVGDAGDELVEFVTTGVTAEERHRIGDPPRGHGILGLLIRDPRPLRLRDLTEHADSYGFPAHHPRMSAFLGVPILIRGTVFGNLYLTEKVGGGEFTDADERLVGALAGAAALVIENARAYGFSERRRRYLESMTGLLGELEDASDESGSLLAVVRRARRAAGGLAAGVVDQGTERILAVDCEEGAESEAERTLDLVLHQLRGMGVADPVDVLVAGRRVTVVRLDAELAAGGLLVCIHDGRQPVQLSERELLRNFATYAALGLDRRRAISEREELALVSDRERIARDLHDVVIQRLFATGMQLQAAARRTSDADLRDQVEAAVGALDTTIRDVRATIFELQTPADGSFRAEVRALVREFDRVLGFPPELRVVGPVDTAMTATLRMQVLTVLREALSNVARHARAHTVSVVVNVGNGAITTIVDDDGIGLPEHLQASGLDNLRSRAADLGGELRLEQSPTGGVRVWWTAPLAG